jgi:hypothetical protein
MKKIGFLFIVIALLSGCASSTSSSTSSTGSLTFNYTTVGIIDGYDHTSKLIVYDNGTKIGESTPKKESEGNSVTLPLSNGTHQIRAVLNSQFEGNWEEHLKANDYSIDCLFEQSVEIKGKKVVTLVFDIKEEKTIIK